MRLKFIFDGFGSCGVIHTRCKCTCIYTFINQFYNTLQWTGEPPFTMGASSSTQAATIVTYSTIVSTPPGECPVQHHSVKKPEPPSDVAKPAEQSVWVSECPAAQADGTYNPAGIGGCPVQHGNTVDFDYRNMV